MPMATFLAITLIIIFEYGSMPNDLVILMIMSSAGANFKAPPQTKQALFSLTISLI